MSRKAVPLEVKMAFETEKVHAIIADLQPLRPVTCDIKKTPKYAQIVASVREVGLVEPPVVARLRNDPAKFLLLDGHLRIEALRDLGKEDVECLVATDDEAYTYNKRVNRIAVVQEHRMILKAIERGVSEERIAKALNVDVPTIRRKRQLLDGICPEVAELLKDKHIAIHTFFELKKLVPLRQITEVQIKGLFANWTHEHRFEPHGADQVVVLDRIEFDPPAGMLGLLVTAGKILDQLDEGYHHRNLQLQKEFAGSA